MRRVPPSRMDRGSGLIPERVRAGHEWSEAVGGTGDIERCAEAVARTEHDRSCRFLRARLRTCNRRMSIWEPMAVE